MEKSNKISFIMISFKICFLGLNKKLGKHLTFKHLNIQCFTNFNFRLKKKEFSRCSEGIIHW